MTDRALAVALVAFFTTLASSGHPAQGVAGPAGSIGLPSSAATCVLRGIAEPRVNANIEDSQGRVIARFSGAPTALLASDFPTDARGRVRIETGTGAGGFRVRGQLAVGDLPLYTTSNVAVVPDHVWIGARRSVSFLAGAPGRLRVEKRLSQPFSQSFVGDLPTLQSIFLRLGFHPKATRGATCSRTQPWTCSTSPRARCCPLCTGRAKTRRVVCCSSAPSDAATS